MQWGEPPDDARESDLYPPSRVVYRVVRLREDSTTETVSQTHWEPRPELDIDLNQELSESRYSDSGGKPVG